MYQRILVPLDGTAYAERALPVAARIARASCASIVLLQVADAPVEALSKYPSSITIKDLAVELTRDTSYLTTLAASDELRGIEITTEALAGALLPTLISAVQAKGIDLIVLCSHGDTVSSAGCLEASRRCWHVIAPPQSWCSARALIS